MKGKIGTKCELSLLLKFSVSIIPSGKSCTVYNTDFI